MLGRSAIPRLERPRLDFWFFTKVIILAAMALFLIYPFATLFTRSFFSPKAEGFTLYNYSRFFGRKYYLNALKNTAFVTFTTTATSSLQSAKVTVAMDNIKTDDSWEATTTVSSKYKRVEADDLLRKLTNF